MERNLRKERIGVVTSNKMDKSITVLIERRVRHPLYGKIIKLSKRYHAHDPSNECREGDLVAIEECRPLSRTKAWRVSKLLTRAEAI